MSSTGSKSQSPSPELTAENNNKDPPVEITDPGTEENSTPKEPKESTSKELEPSNGTAANPWQAIFSPQHNAYYFYNTLTSETTWINPLQPETSDASAAAPAAQADTAGTVSPAASKSKSPQPESSLSPSLPQPGPSSSTSSYATLQAAAVAQGIDPSLAYLDPSLALSSGGPALPHTYTAKFNARTGAFSTATARDPGHLSEYEVTITFLVLIDVVLISLGALLSNLTRYLSSKSTIQRAKRMSEFYFDVGAWEKDVEERKRAEMEEEAVSGRKRKRPTKQDLVSRLVCAYVMIEITHTLSLDA